MWVLQFLSVKAAGYLGEGYPVGMETHLAVVPQGTSGTGTDICGSPMWLETNVTGLWTLVDWQRNVEMKTHCTAVAKELVSNFVRITLSK